MEITSAAKRVVRAFRIAFRAARILATDSSLPRTLRILFVIGCIQIPCLPTDEIALAIALAWLLAFHRPALSRAMREARSSETREYTMKIRTRIAAAAAVLAALAAVVSLALGAVPAFASSQPQSSRPLVAAVVSGATVSADGVTRAALPVSYPPQASCARLLGAYRHVSRQAGLRIGSTHLQAITDTGPRTWARELRAAGDFPLAATALGIRSRATDRGFVMALTASAAAALEGSGCR